jgi:RNA polymerase sigma-70 factor (ECF subfamily)
MNPRGTSDMNLDDDRQLVSRMLAGDQRAFDEFFNGYFDRLYRFALVRLGHDSDAAEDVVQQTLCNAVEKLKYFRGEAALFTWLCQICRNAIVDMFRAKGTPRGETVPFEESEEVRAALESLSSMAMDDPQQSLMNDQVRRIVQVVLDYLPRRYGDVLEWKYMQGLSVKEIAARLGVAPKAAESMLNRARNAFRDGFAAVGHSDALDSRIGSTS